VSFLSNAALAGVKNMEAEVKESKSRVTAEINTFFDQLMRSCQEKNTEMLVSVNNLVKEKEKALEMQENDINVTAQNIMITVGHLEEIMKNGDKSKALVVEKQLGNHLQSILSREICELPLISTSLQFVHSEKPLDLDKTQILSSSIHASNCTFLGLPLAYLPGNTLSFTIAAFDKNDTKLSKGGDNFQINIKGDTEISPQIVDNNDGTYLVTSKIPTECKGKIEISVKVGKNMIKGSPFPLLSSYVPPPPPFPSSKKIPRTGANNPPSPRPPAGVPLVAKIAPPPPPPPVAKGRFSFLDAVRYYQQSKQ